MYDDRGNSNYEYDIFFLAQPQQARSRLELREEATRQDAIDVIEIMKYRYCMTLFT